MAQREVPAFSWRLETRVVTEGAALKGRGFRRAPAMSRRHVKAYPKEFREQVVKLALSCGRRPTRITEEFEISVDSVRRRVKLAQLDKCPRKRRHFKRGKRRQCPLWKSTADLLAQLVAGRAADEAVFRNRRGWPLTRSGIMPSPGLFRVAPE